MPSKPWGASALALAVVLAPWPANADNAELWTQLETRLTLADSPAWAPQAYRFVTVNFWGPRYPGLGQFLLRMGPIWDVHPNLQLAMNLVPGIEQNEPGEFLQQVRLEAEPSLRWTWGGMAFNDRNRLEFRWTPSGDRVRYRNQLRAAFVGLNWPWTPYLSDEVFYDATKGVINQNRALVGLSRSLTDDLRLDASYVLRHRWADVQWERDHLLSLSLTVNLKLKPRVVP